MMYLKIKNKKINILEPTKLNEKIKSFRFYLKPIDFGIRIKKKHYNTYLFCQRVDICITNKDDIIIKLYENIRSEKIKFFLKAKHVYYLPLETVKHLKVGEKLNIKK